LENHKPEDGDRKMRQHQKCALVETFLWAHFLVAVALFMLYLGQKSCLVSKENS
jgi:hypothetical protein